MYAEVNRLFGDIVKVTPTSKAVGDMALFLVANVRQRILRGEAPLEGRPGDTLPPADLEVARTTVAEMVEGEPTMQDVVSYLMYPQVFEQFAAHQRQFSDVSVLPTPVFFHGMSPGEEIAVDIEPGKTLIVKFMTVGDAHHDGTRSVFFELNGQPREVTVPDHALEGDVVQRTKADPKNPNQIGSSMPGLVVVVAVQPGNPVVAGQKLLTLEAMKMETTVLAERDGRVAQVHVEAGTQVEAGDLLITLE
jgi:pyruvate carboxylase